MYGTKIIGLEMGNKTYVNPKKVSDEYMNTAVQKLNISIREMDEQNFNNRHREWLIVNELKCYLAFFAIEMLFFYSNLSSETVYLLSLT